MKLAVAKEHRDFFRKNHCIEFDGLLSIDQCNKFLKEKAAVLASRRRIPIDAIDSLPAENAFMSGRDLWRSSPMLKKLILQEGWGAIASELYDVKPVRIAYDQLIPVPSIAHLTDGKWLPDAAKLDEISCVQGILCGLMLCIAGPPSQDNDQESHLDNISVFSSKAGNGVFFSTDLSLEFSQLSERSGYTYLMVVYTKNVSVYCKKDGDLHTHDLRQLGYNFGDRLSDRYHPLVYK